MEIIHGIKNFSASKFPHLIMGIGNFDGIHLGHQAIIKKIADRAKNIKGKSMIFTFPVHPLNILKEKGLCPQLTALSQKLNLLNSLGIDICLLVDFNREFAEHSPFKFAREILKQRLSIKELFIGKNYRFGKGKRGNISDLKKWSRRLGFKVTVLPLLKYKNALVNSTKIRELLKIGDVENAALLLGRPYTILGQVVKGSRRGTFLGFPTANITSDLNICLKDGVYAVKARGHRGLLNLGNRPTFNEHKKVLEINLFDYSGDLYNQELSVEIFSRLRDELKFTSPYNLINQIRRDIKMTKEFFRVLFLFTFLSFYAMLSQLMILNSGGVKWL